MIYGHADGITGEAFAWRAADNRSRDNGFISRLHRDESHYVLIRPAAGKQREISSLRLFIPWRSDKVVSRDIIADRTDQMEGNFI